MPRSSGGGPGGVQPDRVAEVLVVASDGARSRGSGYRLDATTVLTAAHVVPHGATVRLRFDADTPQEWSAAATVVWSDGAADVAVLRVGTGGRTDPASATPHPESATRVQAALFGRISADDAVLTCSSMGFPRFKLRTDPEDPAAPGAPARYRDSCHVIGTIPVLSNRREGALEIVVDPPERDDAEPDRSPWEGISGAAVLVDGRIVGLLSRHHRTDGLNRLAAVRVDGWYAQLDAERLGELCRLTGLPATPESLVDVVPARPARSVVEGYLAQVRDIAPERLHDREAELTEVVRFCAGERPYLWWQAGPWAGKSALAAWTVLHPPAGVDVVSFFVTGRLKGQADSDSYTEAIVEQSAALAGEAVPPAVSVAGRDRDRRRLLEVAAERAAERGRRLLIVVDGLDEDDGPSASAGTPSIAALLPSRPHPAIRVMVTSRPHPGIPADVAAEHPLRHSPVLPLAPSRYARDAQSSAMYELKQRLTSTDPRQVDVLAFVTAAGGGLSLDELAALTGHPRYALDTLLGGVFGRSLQHRAGHAGSGRAPQVYLFAHDTLRVMAEQHLAADLAPYRDRIHEWADGYRSRGWPAGTPGYLLSPYSRLLAATGDHRRLAALAVDPARHERLLSDTHGDVVALGEIGTAQQMLAADPSADLATLALLAIRRTQLASRNQAIPVDLPMLWARLGELDRAVALAETIADSERRARAFIRLVGVTGTGDEERDRTLLDKATKAVQKMAGPARSSALAELITVLRGAERWRDATELAVVLAGEHDERTLSELVDALVAAHRWAEAAALLPAFGASGRDSLRAQVARAAAGAGATDEALTQTTAIVDPTRRIMVLSDLVNTYLPREMWDVAARVVRAARAATDVTGQDDPVFLLIRALMGRRRWAQAHAVVADVPDPTVRTRLLVELVGAMADTGDWDVAVRTASTLDDLDLRTRLLADLLAVAPMPDSTPAASLASEIETLTQRLGDRSRGWLLRGLADFWAGSGRWTEAARLAMALPVPEVRATALLPLLAPLFEHAPSWADAVVAEIEAALQQSDDPWWTAESRERLVEGLGRAGRAERAEKLASAIAEPEGRARALIRLAVTCPADPMSQAAGRLAADIEAALGLVDDPFALVRLIEPLAALDPGRAERLGTTILGTAAGFPTERRADLLAALAETCGALMLWKLAREAAAAIEEPNRRADAIAALTRRLIAERLWASAEETAGEVDGPERRLRLLLELMRSAAPADLVQARRTAAECLSLVRLVAGADRRKAYLINLARVEALAAVQSESTSAARARETWAEIRRLLDRAPSAVDWTAICQTLVKALAPMEIGRGQQVLADLTAVVGAIEDPAERSAAFSEFSAVLSALGHWTLARRTALLIGDQDSQGAALAMLGAEMAGARHWVGAEEIAAGLLHPGLRDLLFRWIAVQMATAAPWDVPEWADIGRPATAAGGRYEFFVQQIADPYQRARTRVDIAIVVAAANLERAIPMVAPALDAVAALPDVEQRRTLDAALLEAMDRAGLFTADLTPTSADDRRRMQLMRWLLRPLAESRDWTRLGAAVVIIGAEADSALSALVDAHCEVGVLESAAELMLLIRNDGVRADARARVLAALAAALSQRWARRDFSPTTLTALMTRVSAGGTRLTTDEGRLLLDAGREANGPFRETMLESLFRTLHGAGQWRLAEEAAVAVYDVRLRSDLLGELAAALMPEHPEDAYRIAMAATGLTENLPNMFRRDEALHGLATKLSAAGLWGPAGRAVRLIGDGRLRRESAGELGNGLVRAGLLSEAEQVAADNDPHVHADVLTTVALTLSDQQSAQARRIAESAERLARTVSDQAWQVQVVTELLRALGAVDQDRAGRLAGELPVTIGAIAQPHRSMVLLRIVEALVDGGLTRRAEDLALNITDPYRRARGFLILLGATTSGSEEARRLGAATHECVPTIPHPERRDEILRTLASELGRLGFWSDAERMAATVEQLPLRVRTFATLAEAAAEQSLERAGTFVAIVQETVDDLEPAEREPLLVEVVRAFAAVGEWEEARSVAERINMVEVRARALAFLLSRLPAEQAGEVSTLLLDVLERVDPAAPPEGRPTLLLSVFEALRTTHPDLALRTAIRALVAAERIPDRETRDAHYARVARRLGETGQWHVIGSNLETVTDPYWRAYALVGRLGSAQPHRPEQIEEVLAAPSTVPEQGRRTVLRRALVTALLKAEMWEHAERVARAVEVPAQRAAALTEVAERLAARIPTAPRPAETTTAIRRIARLTLTDGESFAGLTALAQVAPDEVRAVYDTILAADDRNGPD
ncbi:trypsin-like peptidase domain-containing protein [Plantactinospora solaniradicis]|uniref:Trypsin-like peptidase domain-containing protein n=1 Tax=Plantactinospora solaniradicis TaxID=1723736 RepID=A0ABW1KK12_9ACTN